jgi:hypothetical protein
LLKSGELTPVEIIKILVSEIECGFRSHYALYWKIFVGQKSSAIQVALVNGYGIHTEARELHLKQQLL